MRKEFDHLPDGTLLVGSTSSSCNNCSRNVLPDSEVHDIVAGYGGGEPGCGIRFTHVTNEYVGQAEVVREMRPDLELIKDLGLEFNPETKVLDITYLNDNSSPQS